MAETKVAFTFRSVNCPTNSSVQVDIFSLDELGILKGRDYETKEELEQILNSEWKKWSMKYFTGGFQIHE